MKPTKKLFYSCIDANSSRRNIFMSKMELQESSESITREEKNKVIENILPDRSATEEEFQNFMQRVSEVGEHRQRQNVDDIHENYKIIFNLLQILFHEKEKIVKKLSSTDEKEQETGVLLADMILEGRTKNNFSDDDEVRVKSERTVINRVEDDNGDPEKLSREAFMRGVEKDANERAEDRKRRNERAETYKRIANGAFGIGDYEKAVTYYGKALEQRKDSTLLWNNRALSYMRMNLHDRALGDLDWALKIDESNIKALLNSAKCYDALENYEKRDEFVAIAREKNPRFTDYINDFDKELRAQTTKNLSTSIVD